MSDVKNNLQNQNYIKFSVFVITSYFLVAGLYYAQGIIVPILFGGILAMLVLPICKFLERKKVSRGLAILCCLLLIISIIGGIIFLFTNQLAALASDFPFIKNKAMEKFSQFQIFIQERTPYSISEQAQWMDKNYEKLLAGVGNSIKGILIGLSEGLGNFVLVIIYLFFFLLFRERIRNFLLKLSKESNHEQVSNIVDKTKDLTIHYLTGLLIEVIIYGTLISIGLLVLGIKQAIFFGFLAGILNLIPYLGALIGAILPIFVAFIYKDSLLYPLGVLIVTLVVQFIDNNFITPKVVAGYIRINALATIIVIIVGGAIWGIAGMILFLPLLGILKIVFDSVPSLQPYGYLIGEDHKESKAGFGTKLKDWVKKKKKGRKDN